MCTLTIWSSVLCVLMVEGMSVVVNVMLFLMSPPPALCNLSAHTVVNLCTLGVHVVVHVWCERSWWSMWDVFGSGRRVDERNGFGLYQSCGNRGSVWRVCVLVTVVYVGSGLRPGSGGVVLCRCESGFSYVYGRSRYLYSVLGGYLRILDAHIVQSGCTLWISAS